jgi:hypothetical protein
MNQMMRHIFVSVYLLSYTMSCHSDMAKTSNDNLVKRKAEQSIKDDTLVIKIKDKPLIIGFTLSQNEYDKLSSEDKAEYDEIYSDFDEDFNKYSLTEDAKKSDLLITASRFIKIKDIVIDKKEINKGYVGFIFIKKDGSFNVVNGSMSVDDFIKKNNTNR